MKNDTDTHNLIKRGTILTITADHIIRRQKGNLSKESYVFFDQSIFHYRFLHFSLDRARGKKLSIRPLARERQSTYFLQPLGKTPTCLSFLRDVYSIEENRGLSREKHFTKDWRKLNIRRVTNFSARKKRRDSFADKLGRFWIL